jgi:hypothetical protein
MTGAASLSDEQNKTTDTYGYSPVEVAKPILLAGFLCTIPLWIGLLVGTKFQVFVDNFLHRGMWSTLAIVGIFAANIIFGVGLALTYGEIRISASAIEKWSLGRRVALIPFDSIAQISMYSMWSKTRIDNIKVGGAGTKIRFSSKIERYDELLHALAGKAPRGTVTFDVNESVHKTQPPRT